MTPPRLLRDEARAWLERALVAAFPEDAVNAAQTLSEYGDSLFAIAEAFAIPDESLIFWVGDHPKGKDWSLASWRSWCERYAAAAALLPPEATQTQPRPPEAAETRDAAVCSRCYANVVQRIDKRWWCAKCGEVQG
jgi:hypothetical protein